MRRRELSAAIVLVVCGLAYGYLAWNLPERSLPNTPGPPFFPLLIAVALLALSVALLVRAIASQPDDETALTTDAAAVARQRRGLTLWLLGAFLAYVVLLPSLGFIVATILFFAGLMVLFGERRPALVALGAVLATAALFALFRYGFGIFLPRGILQGVIA
jgi:putative tricarboxylic transport membrane protein